MGRYLYLLTVLGLLWEAPLCASSEMEAEASDSMPRRVYCEFSTQQDQGFHLELSALDASLKGVVGEEGSLLDDAQTLYREMRPNLFAPKSAEHVARHCNKLIWHRVSALSEGLTWNSPTPVHVEASVLCAHKDVVIRAPSLTVNAVFCTSKTGCICFQAPEESRGWLHALTFERSPGERPFDLFFSGNVLFETPSTASLFVAGAHKVTLEVDPRV